MKKLYAHLFFLLGKKNITILFLLILYCFVLTFFEIFSLSIAIPLAGIISGEVGVENYQIFNEITDYFSIKITSLNLLVTFCIIYVLKVILFLNFNYILYKFSNYCSVDISKNFYDNYLNLPFYTQIEVTNSKIVRNLTQDIWCFSALIFSIIYILSEIIALFFILTFLFYFNWKISLLVFLIVIIVSFLYVIFFKKKIKLWSNIRQKNKSEIIQTLYSSTHSLRELKMYFKKNFFFNNFLKNQKSLADKEIKISLTSAAPRHIIELTIVFSVILIFVYNIKYNIIENILSVITIFVLASIRIIPSLSRIVSALQTYRYNLFSAELFFNILFNKNIKNMNHAKRKGIKLNKNLFFKKNITFENVSFYYNVKHNVLNKINLTINKNDHILILGKSGAGKSTFLDLFTGLQKPKSGKILVDKKYDIHDYDRLWKARIGYVSQKNHLLNDTILNNIIFSKNDKNPKLNKIYTILKNIGLKEEVQSMPEGINTLLGDLGGNKLSGGQLQRIVLARALYKDPEILIIDEGTSALDQENEKKILNYLRSMKITFINCSHKFSQKKKYSQIIEIQKNEFKVTRNGR